MANYKEEKQNDRKMREAIRIKQKERRLEEQTVMSLPPASSPLLPQIVIGGKYFVVRFHVMVQRFALFKLTQAQMALVLFRDDAAVLPQRLAGRVRQPTIPAVMQSCRFEQPRRSSPALGSQLYRWEGR